MVLGLTSCKKEATIQTPTINFVSPVENEVIYLPEELNLHLVFKSGKPVKFVSAAFVNYQGATVFELGEFYTDSTYVEINQQISLGLMAVGYFPPFFLNVRVIDGGGTHTYSQSVELINPKLRYEGIYLATQPSENKTEVYYYDQQLTEKLFVANAATYAGAEVSAFYDMFYLTTNNPASLSAYSFHDSELIWSDDSKLQSEEITSSTFKSGEVFVGLTSGKLKSFEAITGAPGVTTQIMEDSVPGPISISGGLIASDFYSKENNSISLVTFDESVGTLYKKRPLDFILVDIFSGKYGYNFVVFGNEKENGIVGTYQPLNNIIIDQYPIPNGKISQVIRLDPVQFFLNIENTIYRYNYSTNNLKKLLKPDDEIIDIKFEGINQDLFIGFQDRVEVYSYPDLDLLQSWTIPHPLTGMHLRHVYLEKK